MALDQNAQYPVGTTGPNANYPEGEAVNSTAPGALDGYPWEKEGINDLLGFQQALLKAGGIPASGTPDTAVLSQYLQMIVELAQGRAITYDDSGVADAYILDVQTGLQAPASLFDGQVFEFIPSNTNAGASTVNPAALGVKAIVNTSSGGEILANVRTTIRYRISSGDFEIIHRDIVVQVVNVQDGGLATGTTIIPVDDTIPQNTEGDEYFFAAITPKNSNNILQIDIVWNGGGSSGDSLISVALFQDSIASAIAAGYAPKPIAVSVRALSSFRHRMVAGSTSELIFKVRAGLPSAGTTTFNGASGVRDFGGVLASSITITELQP